VQGSSTDLARHVVPPPCKRRASARARRRYPKTTTISAGLTLPQGSAAAAVCRARGDAPRKGEATCCDRALQARYMEQHGARQKTTLWRKCVPRQEHTSSDIARLRCWSKICTLACGILPQSDNT
jgi:hypothetical protein